MDVVSPTTLTSPVSLPFFLIFCLHCVLKLSSLASAHIKKKAVGRFAGGGYRQTADFFFLSLSFLYSSSYLRQPFAPPPKHAGTFLFFSFLA